MKKMLLVACAVTGIVVLNSKAEDAKALYDAKCASCHAKDGTGSTPAGKKLKVKDYTDAAVQAAMKDEEMVKIIKEGVKKGEKNAMPAYEKKLTEDQIKELVAYIRAFKKS